jgi:PAS domain S-box-containing protein
MLGLNKEFFHVDHKASSERRPLARAGTIAAICCALVGLGVLFGWAYDIEVLKRIQPGLPAMNPLAAFCFVMGGAAIFLQLQGRSRGALLLGVVISTLALLKIVDLTVVGVPVDRLLFADQLAEPNTPPNRMAPNTAIAFLLAGLSLAFASGRRTPVVSQALAAAVLLIAMFALVGYGFGIVRLHHVGPFIPMAVHTALLLLVLAVGLMILKPDRGIVLVLRDRGAAGSMARSILPLALLIPVVVGGVRLWGQTQGYYGTETGVALQVIANVLVTSALLISSILALHRSDSIRRGREQALTRSEAQYRLAENVAHVGHWRMELPSLAIHWSEELFRISGRPRESGAPPAQEMLNLYHPDDRARVRNSVKDALRTGLEWQYSVRLCRPDGELRYVSSQGVCERDQSGKVIGLFGIFADVTELENARREAEAATAAKAAFLANMSHEIRTPLNGVMGFAELLLSAGLPPEQQRHATLIFESAQALLKLLNDILDVSKIDAGQLEVAVEPFDLGHQLRQCVRLMTSTAQKKKLELSLIVDPDLPQHILGDGLRIRQVVLNLLGNAVKFTDRGSVTVEAVPVTHPDGAQRLRISVADTGVGIPEARQKSVFEEFVQADASISRRFGGSGLGLSISRKLVALMGGEMALESEEGAGTRVTVTIPLRQMDHPLRRASDSVAEAQEPSEALVPGKEDACVLLVEDLDINRELITGMLARMGYRVEIACDGWEAIGLARQLVAEPDRYQLIFMDVQMPVVDGLAATRAIRAAGGRAAEIPIVALTANAYAAEVEECRDAGMNDHLSKPVSMAALGAALTHWLPQGSRSNPRRRAADGAQSPLAEKFAARVRTYAERLNEIREALETVPESEHDALLSEAKKIAHNLAGTAGMFGRAPLGDLAACIEDDLKGEGPVRARLDTLIEALRRAA